MVEFPRLRPRHITQSPHGPLAEHLGLLACVNQKRGETSEAKRKKFLKWYDALGMMEQRSGTVYLSERWRERVGLRVRRFFFFILLIKGTFALH